ncbi:MAG: hypothetical protein HY986_08300 [Candidatus Melainabacteria bacterium]|nr:hypothetical protein [Candidatus Melainabacteria bacterium]
MDIIKLMSPLEILTTITKSKKPAAKAQIDSGPAIAIAIALTLLTTITCPSAPAQNSREPGTSPSATGLPFRARPGKAGSRTQAVPAKQNGDWSAYSNIFEIRAVKKLTYEDKVRQKTIEMRLTSPIAPGSYPVIIFSHGAGGSKDAYTQLTEFLAARGYICLQPTHDDSLSKLRLKKRTASFMDALATTNDQRYWINRARDIEVTLDGLDTIAASLPKGVEMNKEAIGMGGHSFGAFTTLILAGAPVNIPQGIVAGYGGLTNFGDKRIKAFLVLSGQGTGKVGLCFPDKESYSSIKAPMLLMTGSRDKGQRGQPPKWRMEPFTYSSGNKYLVYIDGANHMTFTGNIFTRGKERDEPTKNRPIKLFSSFLHDGIDSGLARATEMNARTKPLFPFVQKASLAFFDAYLKNSQPAVDYLKSHQLEKISRGVVDQQEQ